MDKAKLKLEGRFGKVQKQLVLDSLDFRIEHRGIAGENCPLCDFYLLRSTGCSKCPARRIIVPSNGCGMDICSFYICSDEHNRLGGTNLIEIKKELVKIWKQQ